MAASSSAAAVAARKRKAATASDEDVTMPGGFQWYKQTRGRLASSVAMRGANRFAGSSMGSNPTILFTKGRGQVDTPQRLVTIAAVCRKDEREQRKIACRGPDDMYAPPAATDEELSVHKGQVGMCYLEAGMTFRLALESDSNVNVFASTAGLPKSGRYAFPCVIQTNGDCTNKNGSNQVTIAIEGRQTIVPYCSDTIQTGDTLYIDLCGNLTTVDGNIVPAIQGPTGLARGYVNLVVRPLPASTIGAMFTMVEDLLRRKMGQDSFRVMWDKVRTVQEIVDKTHHMCDDMFQYEVRVSEDMPIRAYGPIWFLWSFSKMLQIHWSNINLDPATNLSHVYVQLLRAMVHVLKDIEDKFRNLVRDYAASLPHSTDPIKHSPFSKPSSNKSSVHSNTLTDLLTPDPSGTDQQASQNIREAAARIDLLVVPMFSRIKDEMKSFLSTRYLGTALSCATGVDPCDVLLGRPG